MSADPRVIVEVIGGAVQSAQGGAEVVGSSNAYEAYVNLINLAGTLAGTSAVGVGINLSAVGANSISLVDKMTRGELQASDVLQLTGAAMGTVLAVAAVSGVPITAGALAIVSLVGVMAGPGLKDWVNDRSTGLAGKINDALFNEPPLNLNDFSYSQAELDNMLRDQLPLTWDASVQLIDPFITSLQTLFTQAQNTSSPLILDLDGDGVETLGKSAGVQFDHDGNGFAQLSGWAGQDDGLLVLDKSGNGQIDSGAELFGNHTVLANGQNAGQKAANGFAALAELDTNANDKVDAGDAAFASLRVWKDSNADGVAQPGELLTLAQAGVQSLNLSHTTSTTVDANGNAHKQVGNYTRTDGSSHAMNDVWFDQDTARTARVRCSQRRLKNRANKALYTSSKAIFLQ